MPFSRLPDNECLLFSQIQTLTAQLQEARESAQEQKFQDNVIMTKVQEEADQHRDRVFDLEVGGYYVN